MRNPWNTPIRANNETALTALIGKTHEPFNVALTWFSMSCPCRFAITSGKTKSVACLAPQRVKRVGDPRKESRARATRRVDTPTLCFYPRPSAAYGCSGVLCASRRLLREAKSLERRAWRYRAGRR